MRGFASALEISAKIIRENMDETPEKILPLILERILRIGKEPAYREGNFYLQDMNRGFQAAYGATQQLLNEGENNVPGE